MKTFRVVLLVLLIVVAPDAAAWAAQGSVDAGSEVATPAQKKWALALGAILDWVNNDSVDQLGGLKKT